MNDLIETALRLSYKRSQVNKLHVKGLSHSGFRLYIYKGLVSD